MHFIETYWFIWLLSVVLFGGLAIHNQIRRMQNIANRDVFSGLGFMAAYVAIAYLSAGVLILSLVLNAITYAKM